MNQIDVVEAFKMRINGCTYQEIAKVYGVTKQAVHHALNNITRERKTGLSTCIYPGLKRWFAIHEITVSEMSKELSLENATLLYKRMRGETEFRIKEIKTILKRTGMTFEEAFGDSE